MSESEVKIIVSDKKALRALFSLQELPNFFRINEPWGKSCELICKDSYKNFSTSEKQNGKIYKRVAYYYQSENIKFDKSLPFDNLHYSLFFINENETQVRMWSTKGEKSYAKMIQLAEELKVDCEVVIVELQTKLVDLDGQISNLHPFQLGGNQDQYFYRRSYGLMSFLCDSKFSPALSIMEKHFPTGYANLGFYQRLALFQNGQITKFGIHPITGKVDVIGRYDNLNQFDSYDEAILFVESEQKDSQYGVEFILAVCLEDIYWH